MSDIDVNGLSGSLHRLVKLALDTGEASSVEDAVALFSSYRFAIAFAPQVANSSAHQAALLTAVNCGRRAVLGGVEVAGALDAMLTVPFPGCRTIGDAVRSLGGRVVGKPSDAIPLISIGDWPSNDRSFAVRVTFEGWAGGVAPIGSSIRLPERKGEVIAAVMAAALAVAEAFQFLRGTNPAAGRRATGLSLWRPDVNWLEPGSFGPEIDLLPAALWLVGLGNLGQAYLWILGLLPYADPGALRLVLQDFDIIGASNDSTSMLSDRGLVGQYKTRAMASWAEGRGFRASIVERRFAPNFRVGAEEPTVALCGVDNALARADLEDVGFERVIEAGLGKGVSEYLAFRCHVFPGPRPARELWGGISDADIIDITKPAYEALAEAGADKCGLTQLAGRTVGAPFAGTVAGALVISESIRLAMGGHTHSLVDGHLRSLEHRTVLVNERAGAPFNPGTTAAADLAMEIGCSRSGGAMHEGAGPTRFRIG